MIRDFQAKKRYKGKFEGAIKNLSDRYERTNSEAQRKRFREFMAEEECSTCHGDRLKPEILSIKVGGINISDLTKLSVEKSAKFLKILNLTQ